MQPIKSLASSYRDNDGFVFEQAGEIHRLVKPSYFSHYNLLVSSGLYKNLVDAGRLVSHKELDIALFDTSQIGNCKILLPEQLPFISYPYEWSFSMWKDAAIVTLKIAAKALEYGMYLKDATPFNIQFYTGRPVFIDTLSFEKMDDGKPWIAYKQFCECFLAPLLLMHYGHRDMGKLFMAYPNGIAMDMLKNMLPLRSRLSLQVYMHVYMQANEKADNKKLNSETNFSKKNFELLLKGLLDMVNGLTLKITKSTWNNYYQETILGNNYLQEKKLLVKLFADKININKLIDLGANDGAFSLLLQNNAKHIVAVDADVNCVNELYNCLRKEKIKNIVPIFAALNTPSAAIGWNNTERESLITRLKADTVLALALVHHLVIGANVPLQLIATWLQAMGENLIIEFIPKSDEKVILLLQNREDIFDDYTLENFKNIFAQYYIFTSEEKVGTTNRVLFLMQRK